MVLLGLLGVIIWYLILNVPILNFIRYPLDQFYVLWHEAGHVLVGVLTGGSIIEMVIVPAQGGHAMIAGGNFLLFSPAGYLGAAFVGSLFFYLTNRSHQWSDACAFIYGTIVLVTTSMFATSDPITRAISVGFALGFIIVALIVKKHRRVFEIAAILFIIVSSVTIAGIDRTQTTNLSFIMGGITGGALIVAGSSGRVILSLILLNVFNFSLMFNAYIRTSGLISVTHPASHDDAAQFAKAIGGDAQTVASVWLAICVGMFLCSLFFSWRALGTKS